MGMVTNFYIVVYSGRLSRIHNVENQGMQTTAIEEM